MNSRAERRREDRARRKIAIKADGDYGVQPAWCLAEDDLPKARKATHDALIAQMGDSRVGPVMWRWWTGEEAVTHLRTLREHANYYRQIGAHLREWGGYLVVAMAEGRRTVHHG